MGKTVTREPATRCACCGGRGAVTPREDARRGALDERERRAVATLVRAGLVGLPTALGLEAQLLDRAAG